MKRDSVQIVENPTVAQTLQVFKAVQKTTKIFTAVFIKKDGSIREMNCKCGVKKHLKGGELKYNAFDKGLLPVFDLKKGEYRMVNLNTIVSLEFRGKRYIFQRLTDEA